MIVSFLLVSFLIVCAQAQTGTSNYYGGVTVVRSVDPSPWGTLATGPGAEGLINGPSYVWGVTSRYNVTANVVIANPLTNACSFTNNATFAGRIVLFSLGGFCSHAYKIKQFQDAGAVGAIFIQPSQMNPSWEVMANDQEVAPQLRIPANFVGITAGFWLISQVAGQNKTGTLTPLSVQLTYQPDTVYEFTLTPGWIAIQVFYTAWFGVVAIVAIIKLALFIKEQGGVRFTVPQICLFTSFVAAVLLCFTFTLNFLGSRNSTSQLTMVIFREFVSYLWFIPVMIFPFYWYELIQTTQPIVGLKYTKIPFLVVVFVLLAFSLATFVVKGLYGSNASLIQAQIIMTCVIIGLCGLIFVVMGIRIVVVLAKMQDGYASTPVQRRTTFLLIALGVCVWGFVIDYAVSFSTAIGITLWSFMAYYCFFFVFCAFGLAILVFTISPKALKDVGAKISSAISGISGMESGDISIDSTARTKSKPLVEDPMASHNAPLVVDDAEMEKQLRDSQVNVDAKWG